MGFDVRDIRRGMDVYTRDNVYLGSVLEARPGPAFSEQAGAGPRPEEASEPNGELLGPMPTAPLGNPAPQQQGAARGYAASPDGARPLGRGTLRVGRWPGPGVRTISLDEVQTVSLERVVLRRA